MAYIMEYSATGRRSLDPPPTKDPPPSRPPSHKVRVEQIEGSGTASTELQIVSLPDRTKLTLPAIDVDESSESSSMLSPHSEDGNEQSSKDDSIAVDCHTNPSEVIVKGKNVKQIRVKFPPHPPNSDDAPRSKSGRHRLRRSQSGNSIKDGHGNTDDNLPYSQEETMLPDISETPSFRADLKRLDSSISLHSHDVGPGNYYSMTGGSTQSSSTIDWDQKHRQDVLSGMEYFEGKAANFKDLFNRSQRELEQLKLHNRELEECIERLRVDNKDLLRDGEEVKIRLDESEKENIILRDQAVTEWQSRVKIEEMFAELQRDSDREIAALKQKLTEKSKLVRSVEMKLGSSSDVVDGAHHGKDGMKIGLSDDKFELMHRITRLEEDVRKMTRDKEASAESNNRLRQEVADGKAALKDKSQELDSQFKRFLSLKKSFNDLMDENEKLKLQLRGRGGGQHHHATREQITNVLANSTWPAAISNKAASENESVSVIDLPRGPLASAANTSGTHKVASSVVRSRRGSIGLKATKGGAQHKRTKSDVVNLTENLPPVINPSR